MVTISQQTLPLTTSTRQASRRLTASTAASTTASRAAGAVGGAARSTSTGPATRPATNQRVRWGAAVVEPAKRGQAASWSEVSTKVRRGRRTTVWVDEALPKVAGRPQPVRPRVVRELEPPRQAKAGDSFARNRIRHAFELFGACMMIITFLALAMFA
ncbi:MAG: hypothetical protein ACE37K_16120 [Planctomycetota bacterium]